MIWRAWCAKEIVVDYVHREASQFRKAASMIWKDYSSGLARD